MTDKELSEQFKKNMKTLEEVAGEFLFVLREVDSLLRKRKSL